MPPSRRPVRLLALACLLAGAVPAAGSPPAAAPHTVDGPDADHPAPGRFLVARRGLPDPNFSRTVVLLVEVDDGGAMGLVVNRPSPVPARELLPEMPGLEGRDDRLFRGGPVEPYRIFLVGGGAAPAEAVALGDGLWFSSRRDVLDRLLAEGFEPLNLYGGYAGWAPRQLDAEMGRGDWHVIPAASDDLFAGDPGRLWDELIERAAASWAAAPSPAPPGARGAP